MLWFRKYQLISFRKLSDFLLNTIGAIAGLTLTLIVFPFIFIAIKFNSKGPVIYRQKRVGKDEKIFTLYKFRTMIHQAEKKGPELSHAGDSRIIKPGHFLRHYHLDELPQFWNILKGEMSLVGPRPERPYFVKRLRKEIPEYSDLFRIKPGLTSLGMIRYGYASNIEEIKERVKFDFIYLNDKSSSKDARLLMETTRYLVKKTITGLPKSRQKNIQNESKTISIHSIIQE